MILDHHENKSRYSNPGLLPVSISLTKIRYPITLGITGHRKVLLLFLALQRI
jgi:hypothetical protein